jgi:hypothetical protein
MSKAKMGFTNEKALVGMCKYNGYHVSRYLKGPGFVNWYVLNTSWTGQEKDCEIIIHLTDDCQIICKKQDQQDILNKNLQDYIDKFKDKLFD